MYPKRSLDELWGFRKIKLRGKQTAFQYFTRISATPITFQGASRLGFADVYREVALLNCSNTSVSTGITSLYPKRTVTINNQEKYKFCIPEQYHMLEAEAGYHQHDPMH